MWPLLLNLKTELGAGRKHEARTGVTTGDRMIDETPPGRMSFSEYPGASLNSHQLWRAVRRAASPVLYAVYKCVFLIVNVFYEV
jgi:hypothetical protein